MTDESRLGWFLKDCSIQEYILLGAQRALGGQTPDILRQYSFSYNEYNKTIIFKAEVERELTEDERECLDIVETEIQADFPDNTMVKTVISVIKIENELQPLSGGIAYHRPKSKFL